MPIPNSCPSGVRNPLAPVFLRLKLRLLANSFRRSPWQVVGLIIGVLYGLGVAILGVAVFIGLRVADPDIARNVAVIVGSLLTLGFLVGPLAFGVANPPDPRRFL